MAVFTAIGGTLLGLTGTAATLAGIGVVGTGVAVAGTAASISASNRAMSAQKQATQVQIRQQQAQATRARRSAVRQSIMARARASNVAATTGMRDTSAVLGGLGSLSSQVGANLGYGSMMSGLSQQLTGLSGTIAQAQGQAQLFGEISNLGFKFADLGSTVKAIKGIGSTSPTRVSYPQGQQL